MEIFTQRATPYLSQHMYDGELYSQTVVATIAAGASAYIQNKVGSRIFHTISREHTFDGGGPFLVTVTEAPTVTDGTIEIFAVNMNRASAKTHSAQFFVNPTAISGGTLIDTIYMPATGTGGNTTGFGGEGNERNLKINTDYILAVTNNGTQASTLWTRIIFFESGN
jgi:hypothetical protein